MWVETKTTPDWPDDKIRQMDYFLLTTACKGSVRASIARGKVSVAIYSVLYKVPLRSQDSDIGR